MVSWGTNRRAFGSSPASDFLSYIGWPCTIPTLEELVVAQSMSSFISQNSDKLMWGTLCVKKIPLVLKKTCQGIYSCLRLWCLNFVWNFPWVHTLFRTHGLEILAKFPTVNSRYQLFSEEGLTIAVKEEALLFAAAYDLYFSSILSFSRNTMGHKCSTNVPGESVNIA